MGNQLGAACKWSEDKQLQRGLGVANVRLPVVGVSQLNSSGPTSGPPGAYPIQGSQSQPPGGKTNANDASCQQPQQKQILATKT